MSWRMVARRRRQLSLLSLNIGIVGAVSGSIQLHLGIDLLLQQLLEELLGIAAGRGILLVMLHHTSRSGWLGGIRRILGEKKVGRLTLLSLLVHQILVDLVGR